MKKLQYIAILAFLPLLTIGMTSGYFTTADGATKSLGGDSPGRISAKSYGSATSGVVCGDMLCKDYPGGKSGWDADRGSSKTTPPSEPSPEISEEPKMETEKPKMETEKPKMETEKPKIEHSDTPESVHKDAVLKLSRTNVPATIPMHHGYYNGGDVHFIITDSSESKHAEIITQNQGWKVELAPLLANTPTEALSKTYLFTNGVKGTGIHGYQSEVFTSTPTQSDKYSALTSHTHVTWNEAKQPRILDSEKQIQDAADKGEVTLTDLPVVINMPQIVWPGGQMKVKENTTLTDDTPYGGGQILNIDTDEMEVTFIAHRGWGPDGRTIYYIVTDATPSDPAAMMGVVSSPSSANLIANSAAVDLFQFMNGMKGTGPMGFQPGIAAAAPGDENYSPMWRIFMIGWKDPSSAQLLETIGDINAYQKAGLVDVGLARPMDSDHVVNCPFIDPFQ